ncbi:MAG: hypothetical protein VXZ82_06620 [Planctomycetota bacterium]|nr:hypothetical protein [Planctomycetota bacterium]
MKFYPLPPNQNLGFMVDSRQLLLNLIATLRKDVRFALAVPMKIESLGKLLAHLGHLDYGIAECAADYLTELGGSGHAWYQIFFNGRIVHSKFQAQKS